MRQYIRKFISFADSKEIHREHNGCEYHTVDTSLKDWRCLLTGESCPYREIGRCEDHCLSEARKMQRAVDEITHRPHSGFKREDLL